MTATGLRPIDRDTRPRLDLLAPGIHAVVQPDGSWGLSNAGVVTDGETTVLVDTFFTEARNELLRSIVGELAPRPPQVIVNTHHHGDHTYGNGRFPESLVVAHGSTREHLLHLDPGVSQRRFPGVEFGKVCPVPPTLTFENDLRLHVGDLVLDVSYPGLAHCAGSSVVFEPAHGILFAGDLLMKGCTPSFGGGSAVNYPDVLRRLRALDAQQIVPGHGPVCDASVIEETQRYVDFVLSLAEEGVRLGSAPLEVARDADLGEFAGWHDAERIVANVYRAMHELAIGDPVAAIDSVAVWKDTEAYLGRPLRSRA